MTGMTGNCLKQQAEAKRNKIPREKITELARKDWWHMQHYDTVSSIMGVIGVTSFMRVVKSRII
jgi:hypothetical protein